MPLKIFTGVERVFSQYTAHKFTPFTKGYNEERKKNLGNLLANGDLKKEKYSKNIYLFKLNKIEQM